MSVKKNPRTGSWDVRWRQDGRHRSKAFRTRKDATTFEAEVVRRQQLGTLAQLDAGTRSLGDYVAKVWGPQHAAGLAPNSRRTYAILYRVHIDEPLGGVPLRDITPARVREWQAERLRHGAGRKALNQALTLLGSILQRAAEDEEVMRNVVRIVKKVPTEPANEVRPLAPTTVEQVRVHLAGADALLAAVLAYAGLRPAEAWALRWGDIREKTIHVHHATDGYGDIKGTKTGATRTVRLLAPLAQDLAEHRLAVGRPDDSALIFTGPNGELGTAALQHRWRRQRWRPAWMAAAAAAAERAGAPLGTDEAAAASRAAGVDPDAIPRVYALRHSFASLLLAEGRQLHYVAKQMGHSPKETLSTYGHVIEEYDDRDRIDPEGEIRSARETWCTSGVRFTLQQEAV
ncbi:tyrosine-type recombinase/integrase [Patulibacter medicamentivorans]|uniref:tyrosine-type recombinase/integrase n=1 Tax=Patulibacter medicamentivorans TaxID=1097667 RepID=UPI0011100448|nr:tyrosine-type recombinase/integrase [Patulibacter medicamentivorans]